MLASYGNSLQRTKDEQSKAACVDTNTGVMALHCEVPRAQLFSQDIHIVMDFSWLCS